jgi:hypothetical protein
MWIISFETGVKYYLLEAKEYTVGRKGDIQIEDKSVSRVHLTLELAHTEQGTSLFVR